MGATTQETLDALKAALQKPEDGLAKSITVGTGLTAYDLQAPAKNLYPVVTPLRNSIPRVGGGKGPATNWRAVSAITGSGHKRSPWVPEGQRSGTMSYSTAPKAANYVTIGEEDSLTFEAESAGQGFEDLRATMAMRLLQQTMIKEESAILGGNASLALGTPAAPTVTSAATGGTIAAGTYNVIVVGLTLEGYLNATLTGTLALPTAKTITGADNDTFVLNGGSSNKSAAGSTGALTGSTNVINATVANKNGAVAYGWFVGTAGNETLQAVTTINSVSLTSLSTGNQPATAFAADYSANDGLAYDGLLTTAFLPSSNSVVITMPTGAAGEGTPLTASGRGSVVEIDTLLKNMWDEFRLGATMLLVNSEQLADITAKCLSNASGPLLRYEGGQGQYNLTASGVVEFYFNPFTADGGRKIPIKLHPDVPPGTILAHCEQLPAWYQKNNVTNVAEVKCRRDYYQLDFPLRSRKYETGVYAECVLAVYAPFAMGALTNIGRG